MEKFELINWGRISNHFIALEKILRVERNHMSSSRGKNNVNNILKSIFFPASEFN